MSDIEAAEAKIAFLVTRYPLAKDFPDEWKEIRTLPHIKPSPSGDDGVEEDFLTIRLGEVVYNYRNRLAGGLYEEDIEECLRQMDVASGAIGVIADKLAKLDTEHRETLIWVVSQYIRDHHLADFEQLLSKLSQIKLNIDWYNGALTVTTGVKLWKENLGRKFSQYVLATVQLIDVWQDLTGRKVSSPKAERPDKKKKKGPAATTQASTQFIYLALKMIDSKATFPNAVSNIRRAVELRSKLKMVQDKHAGHPDFLFRATREVVDF
jgi:hypothetical protein